MAGITDAYLDLAETVLSRARMPLSTRQIIDAAYLSGIAPRHLHGATQHKTLGARLSEDILLYRNRSRFFRTRPGRFFLRSLIKDKSLPPEYRSPIVARRRRRELRRSNVACVEAGILEGMMSETSLHINSPILLYNLISTGLIRYSHIEQMSASNLYPLYSYVVIRRRDSILVHAKGAYAESRKGFAGRLMAGFPTPICHDDMTLFDQEDHGIVSAGLTAVAIDLDLEFSAEFPSFEQSAVLVSLALVPNLETKFAIVGIVEIEAPVEFQPVGRRLSVSELEWINSASARHRASDYDLWSQHLIKAQVASLGWTLNAR